MKHVILLFALMSARSAAAAAPPYDLWIPARMTAIRDQSTLNTRVSLHVGYADVFFTSNPSADWVDANPPFAVHRGEEIRIHGYLAWPGGIPYAGGTYPAIVVGHGHGGHGDRDLALMLAALGYVALAIDGPQAGQSTGGPQDQNQAWISVDNGPEYGYLYHYAYAGMRSLTLLESLAATDGNPYRIDRSRFGVIGASMGGILASYMNGIDDRLASAVVIASAGSWHHTLRYANSWLYHGIYTSTRDLPYNGADPPNSVENIDTDPTVTTFVNYFDPIRYAPRQHAPVLTIIGTHDEYFPLPNANLMQLATTSAGTHASFEKRLWLLPNAPHRFDTSADLLDLVTGVQKWLNYTFGRGAKPLARPEVAKSGLEFEVSLAEPASRLEGVQAELWAATRVNAAVTPIQDFKKYPMRRTGDHFAAVIPDGDRTPSGDVITDQNVIYFATVSDADSPPVSSLVYKGGTVIDLSSGFIPVIGQFPGDSIVAPLPPDPVYAARSVTVSTPVAPEGSYQGLSLANPSDTPVTVVLEARTSGGRIAAGEGLVNPAIMTLPAHSENIFLAEEWLGPGARHFSGSFRALWSDSHASSLAFKGRLAPSQLDGVGPIAFSEGPHWLPLVTEADRDAARLLRFFAGSSTADVQVVFRDSAGAVLAPPSLTPVAAFGAAELPVPPGAAMAEVRSSAPLSARLEVKGAADPWSVDAVRADQGTHWAQPHVELNGMFQTRVTAVNPGTAPAEIKFRLWSAGESVEASRTLAAGSVLSETAESLFRVPIDAAPARGWIQAETPEGMATLVALAVDPRSGASAASTFQAAATGTWSMPFFVEDYQYYTGLALANPGVAPASATITAYDPKGRILGSVPVVLSPHENAVNLVSQWLPQLPPSSTGQIVITADSPVALLAYFGTGDGRSLSAIPFTHIR